MKKSKVNETVKTNKESAKKSIKPDLLRLFCWIVIPIVIIILLILDALNIYEFNNERLIVLGICLLVVLLPFFSEISIKDLSIKRGKNKS